MKKLWLSPTLHFASILESRNSKFKWDHLLSPAEAVGPALSFLATKIDQALDDVSGDDVSGPEFIYLARKPGRHRKLVNHENIERSAKQNGFVIVHPETLDFRDQLALIRGAKFIIAPEGSAVFLGFFAKPGSTICILSSPLTDGLSIYQPYFDSIGVKLIVLAGELAQEHDEWEEWADYLIPEPDFEKMIKTSDQTHPR